MCSNSKSYSKLEITDCVFNDNNSTLSGGAIYMELYGNISIFRSKFLHNFVIDAGGALFFFNCQPNSLLEIMECDFIENNSTYSGGALYMEQFGNVLIAKNNFLKNLASSGGALLFFKSQAISITEIVDCAFIENNSSTSGGGIYLQYGLNFSIIRSNFSNNIGNSGGAFLLYNSQTQAVLKIANCNFIANYATNYGGAVYLERFANITIMETNFSKNTDQVGVLQMVNSFYNSYTEIIDCLFIENNSTVFGGMYMKNVFKISMIRSEFSKNFASAGAAIYLLNSQSNSKFEIAYCVFRQNTAQNGGTISLNNFGNTSFFKNSFYNNIAGSGASINSVNSQFNCKFDIVDCVFIQNNSMFPESLKLI